jgi:phosphatidate cytidylyltransferase
MNSKAANDATVALVAKQRAELERGVPSPGEKAAPAAWADLAPRALSAAVLIPLALGAATAGGPWLAGAAGAAVVIMSYEWARMSAPQRVPPVGIPIFVAAFGAVVATSWGQTDWATYWLLGWALVAAALAPGGIQRAEALFGAFYIGVPPAAFLWLRGQDIGGMMSILTLFAVIWSADMAGYFAGRLIRGPRFAPAISPQKTWAGVIAGVCAGAAAGIGCGLAWHGPLGLWALVGVGLSLLGLIGDLVESGLKRRFGVKDASRIIPGHGGMLDRLDGLIFATLGASVAVAAMPHLLASLGGGGQWP